MSETRRPSNLDGTQASLTTAPIQTTQRRASFSLSTSPLASTNPSPPVLATVTNGSTTALRRRRASHAEHFAQRYPLHPFTLVYMDNPLHESLIRQEFYARTTPRVIVASWLTNAALATYIFYDFYTFQEPWQIQQVIAVRLVMILINVMFSVSVFFVMRYGNEYSQLQVQLMAASGDTNSMIKNASSDNIKNNSNTMKHSERSLAQSSIHVHEKVAPVTPKTYLSLFNYIRHRSNRVSPMTASPSQYFDFSDTRMGQYLLYFSELVWNWRTSQKVMWILVLLNTINILSIRYLYALYSGTPPIFNGLAETLIYITINTFLGLRFPYAITISILSFIMNEAVMRNLYQISWDITFSLFSAAVLLLLSTANYQHEKYIRYEFCLRADAERGADAMRRAREYELADQAKTAFLANVSHEIRTPLNGVLGLTQILMETVLSGEQERYARLIMSTAERLSLLINDILDLSKLEAQKLELRIDHCDLEKVAQEVIDLVSFTAFQKGLDVSLYCPPHLNVFCDSNRLKQILLNLCSNSIKFTEKGSVDLVVTILEEVNDQVQLQIDVRDTGIGIKSEDLPVLFNRFAQIDSSLQRKYKGAGLGLAISQQLVHLMNGRIVVLSEYGKGTTFRVHLGFKRTPQQAAPPSDTKWVLMALNGKSRRSSDSRRLRTSATIQPCLVDESVQEEASSVLDVLTSPSSMSFKTHSSSNVNPPVDFPTPGSRRNSLTVTAELCQVCIAVIVLDGTASTRENIVRTCDDAGLNAFAIPNAESLVQTLSQLNLNVSVRNTVPFPLAPQLEQDYKKLRALAKENATLSAYLNAVIGNNLLEMYHRFLIIVDDEILSLVHDSSNNNSPSVAPGLSSLPYSARNSTSHRGSVSGKRYLSDNEAERLLAYMLHPFQSLNRYCRFVRLAKFHDRNAVMRTMQRAEQSSTSETNLNNSSTGHPIMRSGLSGVFSPSLLSPNMNTPNTISQVANVSNQTGVFPILFKPIFREKLLDAMCVAVSSLQLSQYNTTTSFQAASHPNTLLLSPKVNMAADLRVHQQKSHCDSLSASHSQSNSVSSEILITDDVAKQDTVPSQNPMITLPSSTLNSVPSSSLLVAEPPFPAKMSRNSISSPVLSSPCRRALVVDDNKINLLVATRFLEAERFQVDACLDGTEAITRFASHHRSDGTRLRPYYDVILMDLQMPGMDGYEVTRRILALESELLLSHTPIIAVTAHVFDFEHQQLVIQNGLDALITKPINKRRLIETLEAHVPAKPLEQ